MSIEEKLDKLNSNLETLIGALAANTDALNGGSGKQATAPAATEDAGDKDAGKPKGTSKKKAASKKKTSSKKKDADKNDDPFGDDGEDGDVPTVEQVREKAFAVRDKFDMDVAKKIISKYAAKLADVKEDDRAALIADLDAKLDEEEM